MTNIKSSNKQIFLKTLLTAQTLGLIIYTIFAIRNEGLELFQIFIKDIISLNWSGQFNLDFSTYLMLSGLWIMWRNRFSTKSIIMALIAMIIGIIAFAPYLIYLLFAEKGDLKKTLIGNR